jgi:hypothetical protein
MPKLTACPTIAIALVFPISVGAIGRKDKNQFVKIHDDGRRGNNQ